MYKTIYQNWKESKKLTDKELNELNLKTAEKGLA